jgi:hypothetical protein
MSSRDRKGGLARLLLTVDASWEVDEAWRESPFEVVMVLVTKWATYSRGALGRSIKPGDDVVGE